MLIFDYVTFKFSSPDRVMTLKPGNVLVMSLRCNLHILYRTKSSIRLKTILVFRNEIRTRLMEL